MQKPVFTVAACVAGAFLLAGCGGSSSSSGGNFDRLVDEAAELSETLDAMTATDAADMPMSGTATYVGLLGGDLEDDDGIIARLTMTADFNAGTIDGSADDWVSEDIGRISGSVPLSGTITGASLSASGDGTLSARGESALVSLGLDGGFQTSGHDATAAIRGDVTGTFLYDDDDDDILTNGEFGAIKQ